MTAPETVKTTEQVSRLITDNVIADSMENVQRNACIYEPVEFAAAMIHMRFAGDKLREGLKPLVTRGMSHLKRNLILEQKSPLNSEAYSSIKLSKTLIFTAEYSFIRHK